MFSVCTPTHRPALVADAYGSLLAQTRADWEWILVPNGPDARIPDRVARDPRVRIHPAPDAVASAGIGALKRHAFERGRGEWLVELDHDDLLAPDALAAIARAAGDTGAGFVYSDFATLLADGRSRVYGAEFGWESYAATCCGREVTAMRAFEANASSLHLVYFAPNHVRAWHRDTYALAGGHDATMAVADDHDLLCRTYLTGTTMHRIPACLYLYREQSGGGNASTERNAEIRRAQQAVSNRYVYALVAEECRRRGLPLVDLGGDGAAPPPFVPLDGVRRDPLASLDRLAGMGDGAVGAMRAFGVLDGFARCPPGCAHDARNPPCTSSVLAALWRALMPGGWLLTRTSPASATNHGGSAGGTTPHPGWLTAATRGVDARPGPGAAFQFQAPRVWEVAPPPGAPARLATLHADLVALKGQRQPGRCGL